MSKKHTPNPTDIVGTYDTSGTAGAAHAKIEAVTPIFDVAKAQDLAVAAAALDPDDDSVAAHMVVLPQGTHIVNADPEAAKKRVKEAAKASAKNVEGAAKNPAKAAEKAANEPTPEAKASEEAVKKGEKTTTPAPSA